MGEGEARQCEGARAFDRPVDNGFMVSGLLMSGRPGQARPSMTAHGAFLRASRLEGAQ